MKLKFLTLTVAAATMMFASCAAEESKEETTEKSGEEVAQQEEVVEEEIVPMFEDVCVAGNDVFVQVEGYEYGLSEPFTTNGVFEVKRSQWLMKTDSTAELKLYNYELGEETENNLDIVVGFTAKNGNLLMPGVYPYQDWDSNLWSKVNIISPQGTVWFNWVSGMPDQGVVNVDFVDADHICGSFMLEVNKPDNGQIGHVVLNGTFSH